MNIILQSASLVMIVAVIILYLKESKLDFAHKKIFSFVIFTCFICLLLDISSIICIYYTVYGTFPEIITKIICKLYIMTLVLQGYSSFLYASSFTFYDKKFNTFIRIYQWSLILGEMLMLILPIYYHIDENSVYSYGPSTITAYILAPFYIITTIAVSFIYRSKISYRRFLAMLSWQGIWLLAALIQFLFPKLLLVGFAAAFGIIILYSQLENPNEYVDRTSGLFTRNAFSAYIRDMYAHEKKFSCFCVRAVYLVSDVDPDLETTILMRAVAAFKLLGKEPVFRIGDESFCILYKESDRMMNALSRIKARIEDVIDVPAKGAYIVVKDSTVFDTAEEFLKFIYMYEESDLDYIESDEAHISKLRQDKVVRDMIEKAMAEDRIEVFYQPFYDVRKEKFTAAEALVRITTEDGDIIPPNHFIPVAERNGQIIPLGIKVFDKVCEFLATEEAQSYGLEYIEVNVSAAQFDFKNPYDFVMYGIKKYGIKPKWINLEITETAVADTKQILLLNMNKLIGEGIKFSLDDFGTGRSNLDYFVNMPISNVKFDYTFTQEYFNNSKVRYVVKGMMEMIKNMDLKVVSEGVETKEQLEVMIKLGAEYVQGFYFSKPLPKEKFIEFLKENNEEPSSSN